MGEEKQSHIDDHIGIIILVRGKRETEEGKQEPFWAYLSVPPSRLEAFKEAEASGVYNMVDYGEILKYGLGETKPPPEAVQSMQDEYGINPDLESITEQAVKELGLK